jgi:hypothetical protein
VGKHWLLSTLAAKASTGLLELEDSLGRYELKLDRGGVVEVVAQQGSFRASGAFAFDALMASRSAGRWTPGVSQPGPTIFPLLGTLLAESGVRRAERSRALQHELVSRPERLEVHDELGALYGQGASVDELNVLSALRARPGFSQLMEDTHLEQAEVEDIVHHLLWRGVVTVAVED